MKIGFIGGGNMAEALIKGAVSSQQSFSIRLRVIYEDTEEMYIVVTAYITSQISRYWKEGQ